jgi:hypothetical protein
VRIVVATAAGLIQMRETAVVRYGAQETELITIHQKALRAATVTLQESS